MRSADPIFLARGPQRKPEEKTMPIPVLELPLVLASLALQPASPAPLHRCGTTPVTVADCCVHAAIWDPASPSSPPFSAQFHPADERTKADVHDR